MYLLLSTGNTTLYNESVCAKTRTVSNNKKAKRTRKLPIDRPCLDVRHSGGWTALHTLTHSHNLVCTTISAPFQRDRSSTSQTMSTRSVLVSARWAVRHPSVQRLPYVHASASLCILRTYSTRNPRQAEQEAGTVRGNRAARAQMEAFGREQGGRRSYDDGEQKEYKEGRAYAGDTLAGEPVRDVVRRRWTLADRFH